MDWPRVALGCGNFGGIGSAPAFFGQGTSEHDAMAIMDIAWERGVRWFDTADAYGGGSSESYIGRWRAAHGSEGLLITTKVFNSVTGDPDDRGLAPDRIRRQVEGSLDRLGVERIDLYLAHDPDPETPIEATVAAFEQLVDETLIGAWGVSNFSADQLEETLRHGLPVLVQNGFSLLQRADEERVLPLCREHGIAYVPFGPLAGGWLAGRYTRGEAFPEGSRMTLRPGPYEKYVADRVFDGLDLLAAEAESCGVDMATLAFAWVLSHPDVTGAVCGPSRPAHLEPVLRAVDISLATADLERIGSFFE